MECKSNKTMLLIESDLAIRRVITIPFSHDISDACDSGHLIANLIPKLTDLLV